MSSPVFTMEGVQDLLEVYPDKVTITPKGVLGFLNKGLKGTKSIPFTSIIAIQFRKADLFVNGFLQFTIPGGNESRGGVFAAVGDENTFMFRVGNDGNRRASEIKDYIEAKVEDTRLPRQTTTPSLSEELQKLATLKNQGVLSETEFDAAKRRLLDLRGEHPNTNQFKGSLQLTPDDLKDNPRTGPMDTVTKKPVDSSVDITFDCPRCGQRLAVEQRGAGISVSCPSCDEQIEIPRSSAAV